MKKLTSNSLRYVPALAGLAVGLLALDGQAATSYYFDVNGTTPGYGVTNGGTYSWDANNWATASGGASTTGAWGSGGFARFYGGASYTVTVNASKTMAGMYENAAGNTLTISDAGNGTGALSITTTGGTAIPGVTGGSVQGFLCNGNVVINCPINGSGGIEQETTGNLSLFATNSYAGGTWVTGGQGIFYNNNFAFGKGVIYVPNSGGWFENDTGTALTVTNRFVFPTTAVNYNFVSGHAVGGQPGTTWSGPVSLPASGTILLNSSSDALTVVAFSGVISGAGANLQLSDNGTCILAGTNTYSGQTMVGAFTAGTTPSLEIAGAIAGDLYITNGTATVKLDHAATLKSSAKVILSSALASGTLNLNYSGTMTVLGVYLDGYLQATGTWGAPGSGANNESPYLSGTGLLYVPASPVVVAQPQATSVYPQTPSRSFTVAVTGDINTMTYQWKVDGNSLSDGASVSGSQSQTLTLYPPYTAGSYTCFIQNIAGSTNSQAAPLSVLATNDYVNAVLQDNPVGYWRLDEATGTAANDWVGLHQAAYINANLNQPGFSAVASSDAGISVPKNTAQRGYVAYTNAAPDFSFPATPFTLEAWAASTNFGSNQRIISTAANNGGGYALSFPDNKTLEFTASGVADWGVAVPPMSVGTWYHCVMTFDGNTYTLYLNGTAVGTRDTSGGFAAQATSGLLCFGNDDPTFVVSEQFKGGLDEIAIYNVALAPDRVAAHYAARYSDAPLSVSVPVANPATNYVSLSSTLTEAASGAGLSYQWYRGAGTANPVGANSSTITLSPLQLSDAGDYHCVVTDAGNHTADSPTVSLTVVSIPTTAAALNLTNGLVLHLPFDSDYADISGHHNNGTAMGATSFATGAAIGSGAVHYGFQNGVSTNYVTLGTPADLKFGASGSFTVSLWVRGTANTDLPFLCDSTNGAAGIIGLQGGFYFGPNTSDNGGWEVGIGSTGHEMITSGANLINDGAWHHLVHVVNRAGNVTTYLDGAQVDAHPVSYVTDNIDTTWPVNIGQDGTGGFAPATDQSGDIDDVAVWNRTLSEFEVEGVYLTGSTYGQSFAPVVVSAPPLTATTISSITATNLSYTGGSATHFVLQGTTNLVAPTWTRLLTNSATPGSFTLPVGDSSSMFYRVSSEN